MKNNFTKPTIDFAKFKELKVRTSEIPPLDVAFQTMALSDYELLVATIYKLNELIEVSNSFIELINNILKWVVEDGLEQAVLEQLNLWLNDGTLENLINEVLFESKLDKTEFEDYKLVVNGLISDVNDAIELKADKTYTDEQLDLKTDKTQTKINLKNTFYGDNIISLKNYPKLANETYDSGRLLRAVNDLQDNSTLILTGLIEIDEIVYISNLKNIKIVGNQCTLKIVSNGLETTLSLNKVNKITIEDIYFDQNLKGRTSIGLTQSNDVIIQNCYFTGYSKEFAHYQTDGGIRLQDCQRVLIENNTWYKHGNQYDQTTADLNRCITVQGDTSKNVNITNNRFEKVNQAIVVVGEGRITINNNHFKGVIDNSVYVIGTNNLNILNNIFEDGEDETIVIKGNNINVKSNLFLNEKIIFVTNGPIKNLSFDNNMVKNDVIGLVHLFKNRNTTDSVDNFTYNNNNIDSELKTSTYPHFDVYAPIKNMLMMNNIFDLKLASTQNSVFKTTNAMLQLRLINNNINLSEDTIVFLNDSASVDGKIEINNNKSNGRIGTVRSYSSIRNQFIRPSLYNRIFEKNNSVIYADSKPDSDNFNKGDIVLNTDVKIGSNIGWVCLGNNIWKEFGAI